MSTKILNNENDLPCSFSNSSYPKFKNKQTIFFNLLKNKKKKYLPADAIAIKAKKIKALVYFILKFCTPKLLTLNVDEEKILFFIVQRE